MCCFGGISLEEAFRTGLEAAAGATANFPGGVVKLEFEKVYMPYLILKKKNYAAMKYEGKWTDPPKLDAKGIATVRRDNCALVRNTLGEILRKILKESNPAGAFEYLKQQLLRLQRGEVSLQELQISKTLRDPAKYAEPHHPQLVVRAKMMERRAFGVPKPGDRVPYVIITGKSARSCDNAEDPEFVRASGGAVKIDPLYYLNNQLRKPILKIMDALPGQRAEALFDNTEAQLKRIATGTQDVSRFFVAADAPAVFPSSSPSLSSSSSTPGPTPKRSSTAAKRPLVQASLLGGVAGSAPKPSKKPKAGAAIKGFSQSKL
jgi:DNA polymerase delta subunit 1